MKTIRAGQLVYWRNAAAVVIELKGLTEVVIRTMENNSVEIALVTELKMTPEPNECNKPLHLSKSESGWSEALDRFSMIKPLLEGQRRVEDVEAVAVAAQKSVATIYRWLRRYEGTSLVSSLCRIPRVDKGEQRLDGSVEEVISKEISGYYLTMERRSVVKLHTRIKSICRSLGLDVPHINTIYARVKNIDDGIKVKRRNGPKSYRDSLVPKIGEFPGADYPNAVVQIDHTPVDVIVVDGEHRLPIGRPYLTISLDVATKMVTGFRVTLDPPGALSAGLCIAHAVQNKSGWLAKRDIFAEWPMHGKMAKIHVDNAKEFRGRMLTRACNQHDIILEYRPKGQPNYGPQVERAFRTFMGECHSLQGTTFSNIRDRLEYNSESKACMTLDELELWFTVFIVYCYHNTAHGGNDGVPPIKRYSQLVHGTDTQLGVGVLAPVDDEESFRLDFLPYKERTVQPTGVLINYINYYSPLLRKWIGAVDDRTNKGRKFIFSYDPRDISVVYFLDPDTHVYAQIPYLNSSRPAISFWELRAALKRIKEAPLAAPDEDAIFKGVQIMRKIEEEAIERTRLAKSRRANEKRKLRNSERRKQSVGVHNVSTVDGGKLSGFELDAFDDDIQPFDEIQLG